MRSLSILVVVSIAALSLAGCAADTEESNTDSQSSELSANGDAIGIPANTGKLANEIGSDRKDRVIDQEVGNEARVVTHANGHIPVEAPSHLVVSTPRF
jgi:hypothetical protein